MSFNDGFDADWASDDISDILNFQQSDPEKT